MPLKRGEKNVSANISELHRGPQYARTKAKHGKSVADKQAVAAAMHAAMPGPSMRMKKRMTM